MNFKAIVRRGLNRVGLDINRLHKSPNYTLLGLKDAKFGSVIDVGANRGQFARLISGFFPNAELYCFEPLEEPFRQLKAWAETKNGRVHCFQLALGEEAGEAEMHLHEQHTPSSSLLAATDNCHRLYPQTQAESMVRIQVSTLDNLLKDVLENMPRGILLKLDVQGFEDRVLRGGTSVLLLCSAILMEICLDPLYEGQADFCVITKMLYEHGFRYAGNLNQVYGNDGRVLYLDAVFVSK